ncbi:peptidase S8/S53 domain-containing protein [Jimgerdemannia flammicorona]|uniref:Peptidase S8/S53 domain-containing protein n=1 Tax=Jimgerdemannia flammicorona TaxID=994334 RepID=A0A433QCK5_9FUNG|nr:peptidase S8/S53 domain-containing protein [Jimgerdemannia flammicorona]
MTRLLPETGTIKGLDRHVLSPKLGSYLNNACGYSPASANAALTVGATDIQDVIADFSNYGPCVNIFAPGVGVSSDWVGDPNGAPGGKLSGTSFSTPYVTGVVALLLSSSVDDHPMNPKQVKDLVTGLATSGTIRGINMDSPNLLVYNGVQELGTGTSGGFKQTTSPSVYVKIVPVIFWGVSFYSWNHGLS